MKSLFRILVATCVLSHPVQAQQFAFEKPEYDDSAALSRSMRRLARQAIQEFQSADRDIHLNTLFRLQMAAGEYAAANATLAQLRELRHAADPVYSPVEYTQYEIYSAAQLCQATMSEPAHDAIGRAFSAIYRRLDDKRAYRVASSFDFDLGTARDDFRGTLARLADNDSVSQSDAVTLLRKYFVYTVYEALLPYTPALLQEENARRYVIDDSVLVRTRDGSAISAIVVRPRAPAGRHPAVLSFTIYAEARNLGVAMQHAANGYVGIVANTRGKRNSLAEVVPFEHDGDDAYDVIGWISRQSWSNGKVGMFGGSYDGFTQWASMKHGVHPALKTIVPSVAVVPGFDTPVENSIYQGFQYPWVAYVTNTRLLDDASYNDRNRWSALDSAWFASGTAYRSLDSIDGKPNPIFQ
ncbi:hypothetical protein BH11GEM2_BH11GEM2_14590 [soil metagenome]